MNETRENELTQSTEAHIKGDVSFRGHSPQADNSAERAYNEEELANAWLNRREEQSSQATRETDEERAAAQLLNEGYNMAKAAEEEKRYRQNEKGLYDAWLERVNQETARPAPDYKPRTEAPAEPEKKPNRLWQGAKGFLAILASIIGSTLLEAIKQSWQALRGTGRDIFSRLTGGGGDGSRKKSKVT